MQLASGETVAGGEALGRDLLVYLGNAWSRRGQGLFDPVPSRNLAVAFDMALAQMLRVRIGQAFRRSAKVRQRLGWLIGSQYPRSADWLVGMA